VFLAVSMKSWNFFNAIAFGLIFGFFSLGFFGEIGGFDLITVSVS